MTNQPAEPCHVGRGGPYGGPLAGLRVLDITTVIMGPYATAQHGDLGADVIKVEPPSGDIARQLGPRRSAGMSAVMLNLGRNKRSAVLDGSASQDRERLAELAATCDVIITNLRPGSRQRLGLDWEEVHQANPAVVLCTAQAFASQSAKGDEPAYDDVIQAVSGMSDLYRRAFGTLRYSPSVLADKISGLMVVSCVPAALHSRTTTGEGQWVDVPMAATMLAFNLVEHLGGKTFEPPVGDLGWSRTLAPNRGPLHAADGWICVMPYTDKNWTDFFGTVARPDLAAGDYKLIRFPVAFSATPVTDYRPAPSGGPHLATVSRLEDDFPLKHEENLHGHHGR